MLAQMMRKATVVSQLSQSPYGRGGILYKPMTGVRRMKTIGLRVKSGFVIAVVADGSAGSWQIKRCEKVPLMSGALEYARFPFHPLIDLEPAKGAEVSRQAVNDVHTASRKQLAAFFESAGPLAGATVIVGSLIDPQTVGNPHIRVHAREGQLFREVVVEALGRSNIPCRVLRDKEAYAAVAKELGCGEAQVKRDVDSAGRGKQKPWRADEKLAALGARAAISAKLPR